MRMTFWFKMMVLTVLPIMAAHGESTTALRFHCAGAGKLTGDTNLATLNQTISEASAVTFRHFALNQVASLISQSWQLGSNAVPLIDTLLADVLENEAVVVLGSPKSNAISFIAAIRVDDKRMHLWTNNLEHLLGRPTDEFKQENSAGKHWLKGSTAEYSTITKGNWLLFCRNKELETLRADYLQKIGSDGSPVSALGTNWLEGDLDLGLLAPELPEWAKFLKPAQIHIQIAPRGNNLEIRGRVTYSSEVAWMPKSWQEPKSLVQSPLISFTAGEDVAAFLRGGPQILTLADNFLTNQFYSWALGAMPLESYLAWPVPNGTNAMEKLSAELPPLLNPILKKVNHSQISWEPKTGSLVWSGLNVVAPVLAPTRESERDYLLLSLLPNPPLSRPGPAALWNELETRKNLVYYDWELTGQRLQQMRMLPLMLWFHPETGATDDSMDGLMVKDEMLGRMSPAIGATITEVIRTAPNELFLIRKGPIGLTGFEMVELFDWLSKAGSQ